MYESNDELELYGNNFDYIVTEVRIKEKTGFGCGLEFRLFRMWIKLKILTHIQIPIFFRAPTSVLREYF